MPNRINPGAIVLIVIGVVFLLNNLGLLQWQELWKYWPALLIIAGLTMLLPKRR